MVPLKNFAVFGTILFTLLALASPEGFAQQRAVRVQSRAQTGISGQRVALVIGNAAYTRISALRNPANDARDIAAVLRKRGFQVNLLIDARRKEMNQAIREMGDALRRGGVGLFYFAGHGVQVGGVNYLVPIGAVVNREYEMQDEAVSANRIMGMMEAAGNPLNMVFLDACRNNPYKSSFRSSSQGLAAVRNAPKGTFISYATGAGSVAADGAGRNGIYTKNMLRFMAVPGLEVTQMMKRVRRGVQQDTGGKQTPYELSSLTGDFYFTVAAVAKKAEPPAPISRPAAPSVAPTTINAEEEFWKDIQNSRVQADFEAYLKTYPNGRFAGLARLKMRRLAREARKAPPPQSAAVPTRPPQSAPEEEFWREIKSSRVPADFEAYLKTYPNGRFTGLARLKIRRLNRAASQTPPPVSAAALTRPPLHEPANRKSGARKVVLLPAILSADRSGWRPDPTKMLVHLSKLFLKVGGDFVMTYSWYEMNLPDIAPLQQRKDLKSDPWSGYFSKAPDPEVVFTNGNYLGADFLLMFKLVRSGMKCRRLDTGPDNGSYTVYLVDVKSRKIHQKNGTLLCGKGNREVAEAMIGLLQEQIGK